MKIKKLLLVLIGTLLILQIILPVYAIEGNGINLTNGTFEVTMDSNKVTAYPEEQIEITVGLTNFKNVGEGIVVIAGQLEYDKNVLQIVTENSELKGLNNWNLDSFNKNNFKFIADNDNHIKGTSNLFKVTFKVNENAQEEQQTTIKIKNISASGGEGIILASDVQKDINIVKKPEIVEKITSDIYKIDQEIISKIAPNTTVAQFKKNVTTEQKIVFIANNGSTLSDTDIITTDATIKVGKTLTYTACVIGDIDKNGIVSANDVAKIKLTYINLLVLDKMSSMAADADCDGIITINDVAKIKLLSIAN